MRISDWSSDVCSSDLIETFIDLLKRQHVCDQVVDVDLLVHVPVDDFRHVGATACAAERRADPAAAGDQLERPSADFLAGSGAADDGRYAPAAHRAFERLARKSAS